MVILSTIILRAITFIFSYGYIPSLTSLLPHEGVIPDRRDDFGVTLLKIGTACIEATSFSGLRNELASADKPREPWVEITSDGSQFHHGRLLQHSLPTPGFSTEINHIKVSEAEDSERLNPQWREVRVFARALFTAILSALVQFLMSTRVGRSMFRFSKKMWRARWWYGPRSWKFWRREAWREPSENVRARARARELARARARARASAAIIEQVSGPGDAASLQRSGYSRGTSTSVGLRGHDDSITTIQRKSQPKREMWTYADYLLKDVDVEIEDDGEWVQEVSDDSDSDSEQMSIADVNEEEEDDLTDEGLDLEEEEEEVKQRAMLYGDLVTQTTGNHGRQSTDDDLQPVLLAHLTSRTAAPLTRQRYTSLMTLYSSGSFHTPTSASLVSVRNEDVLALRDVMHERRQAMKNYQEEDEETKSTCVVCMVSMRDTILWPCR